MAGTSQFRGSGPGFALSIALTLVFLALAGMMLWNGVTNPLPKSPALVIHMFGGAVVLLVAPFQFMAPLRNRWRRLHKAMGYVFLGGSAVAIGGYLAVMPGLQGDVIWLSQFTAIVLWGLCATTAYISIRKGRVLAHRHNMARAFALAAYFVIVRLIDRYGMDALTPFASGEEARYVHSDWLAWVVPLVLVEIWFGREWYRLLDRSKVKQASA